MVLQVTGQFLKCRENGWRCMGSASPLTNLPLHPWLTGTKVTTKNSTFPLFNSHINLKALVAQLDAFQSAQHLQSHVQSTTDRSDSSISSKYCGNLQAFHLPHPSVSQFYVGNPSYMHLTIHTRIQFYLFNSH